jgi:glycosyltransferase involved in cell wall biosynthesis
MSIVISIFGYNRPDHLKRLLQSLLPQSHDIPIYLFIDAPSKESDVELVRATRDVASSFPTIISKTNTINKGLSAQIVETLTDLFRTYNFVIVLEDDLILAPFFIDFLVTHLPLLSVNSRILQISGHMFDLPFNLITSPLLLPVSTSWGWATSSEIWFDFISQTSSLTQSTPSNLFKFNLYGCFGFAHILKKTINNELSSWAILFYLYLFNSKGYVVHPPRSLVLNSGFNGASTHGSLMLRLTSFFSPLNFKFRSRSLFGVYKPPVKGFTPTLFYYFSIFVLTLRPLSFFKNILFK